MKIFLTSDVHFEFHNKIDWLPSLPAGDQFDVLVLAGDIGHGPWLETGLRRLRCYFPTKDACHQQPVQLPERRSKMPVGFDY